VSTRWRSIAGTGIALLFAGPLLFMLLASLRRPGLTPPDGFELLPPNPTLDTYDFVFLFIPLWRQLANSAIVSLVAVPVTVVIASWAGFAIATSSPARRNRLVAITVVAMMVPLTALWVPRFVIFRWLGLTDTLAALMMPALMATTPFYVLIFALAHYRVPRHLYEAAQLDGWSPFQVWRRVASPLVRPATFAVAVLAFISYWSNLVDPLLYLNDTDLYTVPLGLRALQTLEPQNFPLLLAAAVMATLPAVTAFLAAQRAFFDKTLEASP
jgi:multiple sugar transport system permease protein